MLLFYPAGLVMDRFGRVWIAVPCTLMLGLGMLVLPLTSTLYAVLAVASLMAIGNGLGSGIIITLGADAAPPALRAQFLAGWAACAELGGVLGPLLISAITFTAPLAAAALTLGALTTLGATWLAHWVPTTSPTRTTQNHPTKGQAGDFRGRYPQKLNSPGRAARSCVGSSACTSSGHWSGLMSTRPATAGHRERRRGISRWLR